MGCSSCGRKYPRGSSSRSISRTAPALNKVNISMKKKSVRGVIQAEDTKEAVIASKPDCGPVIPSTGQYEYLVTSGESESTLNTEKPSLTIERKVKDE